MLASSLASGFDIVIVSDWLLFRGDSSAARGPRGVHTCDGPQTVTLCAQEAVESRAWAKGSRSLAGSSWPCQGSLSGKKPFYLCCSQQTSSWPLRPVPSLCLPSPCAAPHALPWLMALSPGHCPVLLFSTLTRLCAQNQARRPET